MHRTSAHAARPLSAWLVPGLLLAAACLCAPAPAFAQGKPPAPNAPAQSQPAPAAASSSTPTETVRAFYKALSERRFREAFALSVLGAAVEKLSAEEFAELRPDFERLAAATPPSVEVTGEVLNGDVASVFIKPIDRAADVQAEEVKLLRAAGRWVVGERGDYEVVGREGKDFLFRSRIETHHEEVEAMMKRIAAAEYAYATQHGGAYGDLGALVAAGLVPQDVTGTESTGYRFHVNVGKGGNSWEAGAEPVRYGRTGRLSFRIDNSGLTKKDTGGKPLKK